MKYTPNLQFKATKEAKPNMITCRIPTSLKMALNDRCEQLGTTRTTFMTDAIEKAIERS